MLLIGGKASSSSLWWLMTWLTACPSGEFSGSSAFFLVGYHLDNICHLLIDNLLALASNIITAPHCQGQLPCQ